MPDIKLQGSEYIQFYLKSQVAEYYKLTKEPIGWSENGIELVRHKKYHGIMTQFTGDLSFFGQARKYIKTDFKTLGINSELELHKYELRDTGERVEWDLVFVGVVDYSTYSDKNGELKVKFNSNKLEELLKTREGDDFELERDTAISGNKISKLETSKVKLEGVTLAKNNNMEPIIKADFNDAPYASADGSNQYLIITTNGYATPVLEALSDTDDRISTPDTANTNADEASKMFFVDSVDPNVSQEEVLNLQFSYRINVDLKLNPESVTIGNHQRLCELLLVRLVRNDLSLEYDVVSEQKLDSIITSTSYQNISAEGNVYFPDIKYNEGLLIALKVKSTTPFDSLLFYDVKVNDWSLNIATESNRVPSENCEFVFIHDCFERLTSIITGFKNRFLSRTFGRQEIGYENDGQWGLIGLISGLWIRQFTSRYEIYKSISISMADLLNSVRAVFNVGLGIELIDGIQKIVVEDLKFFYQNQVVIILDDDISDYEEVVVKEDYISTIEIGYSKGGDYDNTTGLDEPNVETSRITPINRNKQTYRQISTIRADDIGAEIIRRKPAKFYPSEDTSQDDDCWFLDLNRTGLGDYVQKTWVDRLRVLPSGLSYSNEFKSFLFTPLRMLFRHGWIIRSGMEERVNLKKYITVNSSKANQTLRMWFTGDDKAYSEGEDIQVTDLERARTQPKNVSFTYNITEDLVKKIFNKTVIEYNGTKTSVPNYYFKFEWTTSEGEKVRGFLTSMSIKENKFEFLKANDNLIY